MKEVTDATFETEVLRADGPVVVDFWAPWCGPCHAAEAALTELERDHEGRVLFAKLNVDDNFGTSTRYDVLTLPTAILFENGEPQESVLGARPRSYYERAFGRWLRSTGSGSSPAAPAPSSRRV